MCNIIIKTQIVSVSWKIFEIAYMKMYPASSEGYKNLMRLIDKSVQIVLIFLKSQSLECCMKEMQGWNETN